MRSTWHHVTFMSPEVGDKLSQSERKEAFQKEKAVWEFRNAYERVERSQVPKEANILGSHTVYLRKDNGMPKARIVPWGHRDPAKHDLRCDLPFLNPETFRLILSITVEKKWRLAQMDAEVAFLQAQGFSREVFIHPPKEAGDTTGLWKLLAPAYGLADSGRLWYRANDSALLNVYNLQRSS